MDKRFVEISSRLDAIEAALKDLKNNPTNVTVNVTKEDLTKIKGVGEALADEILKVMYR